MAPSGGGEPQSSLQIWASTYRELTERPEADLGPSELEQLAIASYLVGDDDRCASALEAAHRRHLDAGNRDDAALCSFWLAFSSMMRGQMAQAGAWLGRADAIMGDDLECRARGYVLIPAVLGSLESGDLTAARELAARVAEIASTFDDADLAAFACLGDGQALVAMGELSEGTARFDEVMLKVSTGQVGPITSGVVYCAVVLECMKVFDLPRAVEWTDALHAWCADLPELVPYRGQCLVHQSQLLQAAGDWPVAVTTIEAASDRLSDPPHPALGLAHYQQAELHRLVGSFDDAAVGYRRASASGHETMPGLALLALAQGDVDGAAVGIRRALQETILRPRRLSLLAAAVDVFRDANDLAAARAAADELAEISTDSSSEVLQAMADLATGAVTLSEGDPAAALAVLRDARTAWARLQMPYEAARTSVLLGLGCVSLGDRTSADLEFENARLAFERLGARPDLERLRSLRTRSGTSTVPASGHDGPADLSGRELEVLAHVAQGETNRQIAAALTISQHTVGRHLENIFAKLGVSGRAAATAYAYEHDLL
jgi:DNA-binding CsgD family transcriptional regulator/tetratricopeptide (TPR) repeat protein